jgi:hypothetical protein
VSDEVDIYHDQRRNPVSSSASPLFLLLLTPRALLGSSECVVGDVYDVNGGAQALLVHGALPPLPRVQQFSSSVRRLTRFSACSPSSLE